MEPLILIISVLLPGLVNCPQFKCKEYLIKQVHYLPDSLEKYRTYCTSSCNELEPHLVVNEWGNETWIGCFKNIEVAGYCVEYNSGKGTLQSHQSGYCRDFDEPCPGKYDSRDSFKYRQCFYQHGGIQTWESLYESKKDLENRLETCNGNTCTEDDKTKYYMIIPIAILSIAFIFLAILTILKNRKQPTDNKNMEGKESLTENTELSTSSANYCDEEGYHSLHSSQDKQANKSAPVKAILHQPCSEPSDAPRGNPYLLVDTENIDVNDALK
ncbi:uncharacterized protein LOC134266791 [Saccostrea cucullata]|uniref:uncharacterized protein LOC134266791 n=1 Tax=Saccostrea cuccullata TaxID=36930 RepID=UPI002ED64263